MNLIHKRLENIKSLNLHFKYINRINHSKIFKNILYIFHRFLILFNFKQYLNKLNNVKAFNI